MAVSKIEEASRQQDFNSDTDRNKAAEVKRRIIYKTAFKVDRNIALNNLFEGQIPKQFACLRKNAVSLLIMRHHMVHSRWEVIKRLDGSQTLITDLAETRWTSRASFAKLFCVSEQIVKRAELLLRDNQVILTEIDKSQMKNIRYMALSPLALSWLKLGGEIPEISTMPKRKKSMIRDGIKNDPIDGVKNNPSIGSKTTPEYKKGEYKKLNNDETKPSSNQILYKRNNYQVASDFEKLLISKGEGEWIDFAKFDLNSRYKELRKLDDELYSKKLDLLRKRTASRGTVYKIITPSYSWDDFFDDLLS